MRAQTYTVRWSRPNDSALLECRGLTARVMVSRLIRALHNNAAITVHSVRPALADMRLKTGKGEISDQ